MEQRSHKGTVEVRQSPSGGRMIAGYAAVFNKPSSDMGFIERIDPGAFKKTLGEADVRGLGNHDVNWLLGRSKPGTLRMSVDNVGLLYEIDVNESDPDGVRAIQKVSRGDWDGSSFSFNTIQDQWDWSADPPQRRLLEVSLVDVGPVTFPAYPDATAMARALEPIAAKTGHKVEDLVTAMRSGAIRSLIDGGGNKVEEDRSEVAPDDLSVSFTEGIAELRTGKAISAATAAKIRGAMDQLRELLAGSETDGDDDDGTLVGQALESDSITAALETNSLSDIDIQMRMRELAYRGEEIAA